MKTVIRLLLVVLVLGVLAVGAGVYAVWHYGRGLPDYHQLADYQPPTVTRVYAGDGRLLAEFATEKRVFVPIEAIPRRLVNAFLAAEDGGFYEHAGVDFVSVARAAVQNLIAMAQDPNRRPVGASTITQQVAKNFLLTNEVSIKRKIREALLAFRIEKAFTKDRILELYLNEIYLGYGSYGVTAAALNYFNKSLDDLTVSEAAYLAALPKAPNNYHPIRRAAEATARRNWVVERMAIEGFVDDDEAREAMAEPLAVRTRDETELVRAPYFEEEVRRELAQQFGDDRLYGGGLTVHASIDPRLQDLAQEALRGGLVAYDRRHGWRGALARIEPGEGWAQRLAELPRPAGLGGWQLAVALSVQPGAAEIGLPDGSTGSIPLDELKWARAKRDDSSVGPAVQKAGDVLAPGDVVPVEPAAENEKAAEKGEGARGRAAAPVRYALRQIPEVQGGLVALDLHTGRVLAMVGGFSQDISEFNRATQAMRQPGSSFKPFVYLSALDHGFSPASMVLDGPFVIDQGAGLGLWKPKNYSDDFLGPATLRVGLEKSRNLMTVRLAQAVGMKNVAETSERFGIYDRLPQVLSMSLGAGETTLLRLATAYAMLVNGGKRITPTVVDRVQDRTGATIFRHDERPCEGCREVDWTGQAVPEVPDLREQIGDPVSAYQVVHMLEGVVERGTGTRVQAVGKPIAGKTGTTNDSVDAWFVGFTPDLAAGVYIGFDRPRSLGPKETGASAAAPIFTQFMKAALENAPATPFRIPPGVRMVRVDAATGRPAGPGTSRAIFEAFRPGTIPSFDAPAATAGAFPGVAGADGTMPPSALPPQTPSVGTGGLY